MFARYDGMETQLMDPLILGCGDVVQEVLPLVRDRTAGRRIYAIAFLRQSKDSRALTTLVQVAEDHDEAPAVRAAALRGVDAIDHRKAVTTSKSIIAQLGGQTQDNERAWLVEVSAQILDGRSRARRERTWAGAFFGAIN